MEWYWWIVIAYGAYLAFGAIFGLYVLLTEYQSPDMPSRRMIFLLCVFVWPFFIWTARRN